MNKTQLDKTLGTIKNYVNGNYLAKSGGTLTGTTIVRTAGGTAPLVIQRNGNAEQTKIYQDDTNLTFDMTNDETAANMKFVMNATDTESGSGTNAFSNATVTFSGSKNGSTVTAGTFTGALNGNANTATKATQDSAGQQINTTYIKGLSVSGKTITYTKGNGNTGTITTQDTVYTHPTSSGNKHIPSGGSSGQILRWSADGTAVWGNDNNTTYSTGTSSTAGLTKLYTSTGTATDGTMTQAAIKTALDGKAASSHGTHVTYGGNGSATTVSRSDHTHNYAGSGSAGGTANSAARVDVSRLTGSSNSANYQPGANRLVVREYGSDCSNMPSAHWYHIYTGQGNDANYNTQIAVGMTTAALYYRNRNSGTWGSWTKVATTAAATTSANGLMTSAMVTKLNGIASNANNYTHPTSAGNKHIPSGGAANQFLKYSASGTAAWSALPTASTSTAGIVQLSSSTSGTSETKAATEKAVKTAYDKGNAALPKAGGTMTGSITLNNNLVVRGKKKDGNTLNLIQVGDDNRVYLGSESGATYIKGTTTEIDNDTTIHGNLFTNDGVVDLHNNGGHIVMSPTEKGTLRIGSNDYTGDFSISLRNDAVTFYSKNLPINSHSTINAINLQVGGKNVFHEGYAPRPSQVAGDINVKNTGNNTASTALPNSFLIQAGRVHILGNTTSVRVSFPNIFNNYCMSVVISPNGSTSDEAIICDSFGTYNVDTTGFNIRANKTNIGYGVNFYWIAFGW